MIYIKKYTVKLTPSFEKDFKKIYEYLAYALQEPIVAKNFYNRVKKEIFSLQYFPERYAKLCNYINQKRNIRKFPVHNYIILYEVNHDTQSHPQKTLFSQNPFEWR